MSILTKQEMIGIIESRLKGLEYSKYSLEVDQLVENAKDTPGPEVLTKISESLEEIANQLSVLNAEMARVDSLTEQESMPNLELVVAALQERVGQLVANYETQVALLRAELTELSQKEKAKEEYNKSLDEKLGE